MSDLRDDTVLVTGGAGFIGSHLVERLVGANDVRVLDDLSSGARAFVPDAAEFVEGDVRDERTVKAAMADVDVVFHQAALVSVPESISSPAHCHSVNGTGTVNVLECARRTDSRVVLASSAAVYGEPESVPIPESHPTRPRSPYGVEKLAGDHLARVYEEQYGLPTVALRYFNIYGPGMGGGQYSGVVDTFFAQAASGGPITVDGDGEQTRDFVYVDDVVHANLRAATTDAVGQSFNIGTGDSVTIDELAHAVRRVVETDADIVYGEPRPGDIRDSEADTSRAETVLGFETTVDLETGLSQTWAHRAD